MVCFFNQFISVADIIRITILNQTPTSFAHSGCVINDHLLIFGGFCDDLTQNHTLLLQTTETGLSPDSKMFQLRVRGDIPPARERHSCSVVAGKKTFIFGGFNRTSDMYYNSVFLFDSGMFSSLLFIDMK